MDKETGQQFAAIKADIVDLKEGVSKLETAVASNLAFHKGLDLANRMTKVERDLDKKASWMGLYLSFGLLIAFGTLIVAIVALLAGGNA